MISGTSKPPMFRFSPTVMEAACTGLRVENATALLPSPRQGNRRKAVESVCPGITQDFRRCSLPAAHTCPQPYMSHADVAGCSSRQSGAWTRPTAPSSGWAWRVPEAGPLAQARTLPQAGSAPGPARKPDVPVCPPSSCRVSHPPSSFPFCKCPSNKALASPSPMPQ